MLSTPEQHEALFQEILAEMTPERLAEALKPMQLPPISIELTEEDRQRDRAMYYRLGAGFIVQPTFIVPKC